MATKDFRASQVETSKIIGTGSISGTSIGIAIYSGSVASNREGGSSDSNMFSNVGSDVFLFVSGTISEGNVAGNFNRQNVSLFGGDLVVSGTLYAERQVVEVDSTVPGNFFVTGNMFVEPDSNSTKSVAFRNAAGTDIFIVDSTNQRIGVGVTDPDSKVEIFGTGTQLKLSNNADDSATFAVGTNGDLTITTVDAAAGAANFTVVADGAVDIDANAGSLSLDGSTGINIGTEADVAIDIDASTLDVDASDNITITAGGSGKIIDIDASGALTIDSATSIGIGTSADKPIDIDSTTLDIDASGEISIDGTAAIGITSTSVDTTIKSTGARVILSGSSGNDSVLVQSDIEIVGSLHGASPLKINDDIALTGSARFKEQSAPNAGPDEAVLYAKDDSGVTKLFTRQSDGLEVGPLGSGGSLDDAYDTPPGGGTKSPGVGAVITADGQPVQIRVAGSSDIALAVTGSVIFGSGSTGLDSSGLPALPGSDTHFFVSGSKGGQGTFGTSVFGGDLVVSGNTKIRGTQIFEDEITVAVNKRIYFDGSGNSNGPWIRGNTTSLTLNGDDKVFIQYDDQVNFNAESSPNQPALHLNNDGRVLIHSGGSVSSYNEAASDDVNFYVSGSVGSRGTSERGTSIFGGDIAVSGTLAKLDSTTGNVVAELTNTGLILPASKEIQFRSVGQKIFADASSNLFVSASMDLRLFSQEKIILNAEDGGEVRYHKGNTEFLRVSNSSNDAVIQPIQTDKDIIFKEDGGAEVFRIDSSAKDILMAAGNNVSFGAATRYIGDGTDDYGNPNSIVINGSNDVILGPGANSQAFISLGTNGQFVIADGAGPTNYLLITGSDLGGILSSSVHNKNIVFHANNANEVLSINSTGEAVFNVPGVLGEDTSFAVSGSIGSRGTSTKGTAVFTGDIVVSGTMSVNRGQAGAGSAVTVTTEGKVGIGTDNPSYKLEVGGNASFGEFLYHRNNASGQNTYMRFENDKISFAAGNQVLLTLEESGQDIVTVGDGGDVDFQVRTNGDDNTLYVHGSSDRVGIGTNSPVSILHVKESAPTVSIQRESNSNDSTIAFLGQAGFTGALMHLSKSNDLVFKTHDGSSPHEIMRLGGHFASDVRQVILLSGSKMAASAMQPKEAADINFFVSGAIDSRGTTTRGTATFGGDVVISGAIRAAREVKIFNNNMQVQTTEQFWSPFRSGMDVDVQFNISSGHTPFSFSPYSGSLDKVLVCSRQGEMEGVTVAIYKNGNIHGHMTASMNGSATSTPLGNLRKGTFDFNGGSSLAVTGSNLFDPNDLITLSIKRTGGTNTDCSITTVFSLDTTVDGPDIIIP